MNSKCLRRREVILHTLHRCCYVLLFTSCLVSITPVGLSAVDNTQAPNDVKNVPATYFGTVLPDSSVPNFKPNVGQVVRAQINGNPCGQSTTISDNSQIVYRISVISDSDIGGSPGCGVQGATVTFFIDAQLMQPTVLWSSGIIQEVSLRPAPTATPTPTATLTPPITPTPIVTPTITPNKPVSIPEPVTLVLLGTGLTVLSTIRIFRKHKSR